MLVVKSLLEQTGPIALADYNETISADNLFERTEYHSEINFFPGSTQKQDFLGALTRNVKEKILGGDKNMLLKVGKSIMSSLNHGELLVYFDQAEAQSAITQLGWSGEIKSPPCHSTETTICIADLTGVVEANLGVNKVNYYITRKLLSETEIKTDEIVRTVTLQLHNASAQNEWPGGVYKNYLRFYIPANARVQTAQIDAALVASKDIAVNQEHEIQNIGFLVNVPVRSTTTVTITYTLPVPKNKNISYQLLLQKQAGVTGDSVQLVGKYDKDFTFLSGTNWQQSQSGRVTTDLTFTRPELFTIELAR
jgi:hypothetical protein